MDPLTNLAQFMESFGPYAMLILLGWGYLRKDKQLQKSNERNAELLADQIEINAKVEAAINSLKDLIKAVLSSRA